jgi:hypothetical protein
MSISVAKKRFMQPPFKKPAAPAGIRTRYLIPRCLLAPRLPVAASAPSVAFHEGQTPAFSYTPAGGTPVVPEEQKDPQGGKKVAFFF